MPDLDTELRHLARALIANAPIPPRYEDLWEVVVVPESRRPRRAAWALVVALVVIVVGVGIALAINDKPATTQQPIDEPTFVPCQEPVPSVRRVGPDGKTFGGPSLPFEGDVATTITEEELAAAMPDFVPALCNSGALAGYISSDDLAALRRPPDQVPPDPIPPDFGALNVYAPDGTTLVGHIPNGGGFVPLGEGPAPTSNPATSTAINSSSAPR